MFYCIVLYTILTSAIHVRIFLNINRGVSVLVKFATRSGHVHYVGKVVGAGDGVDIYTNRHF